MNIFLLLHVWVPSTSYEKYLSLSALVGQSRMCSFQSIQDQIWNRIHGWKEKFLSQVEKEVLLKAVIQVIPTYTISVFQLLKALCKKINAIMARFWWGHKEDLSRIAWLGWERLNDAKNEGGLSYRNLELFNQALLAKQGWRFLTHPQSLVAKIFQEKYYWGRSFLDSNLGRKPSYAWRSIWSSKKLLNEG